MTTENLGELFAAMAAARLEFGTFAKSKTATIKSDKGSYVYNYADLSDIIEATAPALAKHGLVIIQEPEVINEGGRQSVVISGCIAHKSGGVYQFRSLPLPVAGGTAQAVGSAISYARRYQMSAVLNLAASDDDAQTADGAQDAPQRAQATPTSKHTRNAPTTPQDAPTQATSKPRASVEQVHDLDTLGVKFYGGKQWPAERTRLSIAASKGAVQQPTELMESEIAKLIKGLTDEIAKAEQQPEASLENVEALPH